MAQQAFQELIAERYCWGCGLLNQHGLQIRSYWSGDQALCTWQPRPYHAAGPRHILNGGVIATIIDCHCICTAIAAAYRAEGRPMDTEPSIWFVTASLHVAYLKPTPIDGPVSLQASVKESTGKKAIVTCSLFAEGDECAKGEVVAVRVPETWRQAP